MRSILPLILFLVFSGCSDDSPSGQPDSGEDAYDAGGGDDANVGEDASDDDYDDDYDDAGDGGDDAGAGGDDAGAGGDDAGSGTDDPPPVDCSGIDANPNYELCVETDDMCAGVYTNGAGCIAYCAAAGLVCVARFGGEPDCQKEATAIPCNESNTHMSDWCECGRGDVNPDCEVDPGNPPAQAEQLYTQGTYNPRSSWVLECRDYAYTAQYAEHEACDSEYVSGSGRGTATFNFNVNRGTYDVYIEGRHTTNRNPAGALVIVTSRGQSYSVYINQRDDAGMVMDLHGRYCLEGLVEVVMDSSVSSQSDSVRRVRLVPVN